MDEKNDALFSLELVVEKLYLPHVTCRFPAVAFRMLDFPTVVIKHVEDDLAAAIHQKVHFESPHHLPQQFLELKDRHGNFMVKKGKSCLFKMTPEILKQHLINTPLYVMVIDLFNKVPKLLGNSTVPLDSLINLVLTDIAKFGPTVPSVHGDKGLFKLCNLMGNEIGYVVLGFRLLCLGPSLIPHLPQETLAQMSSHKQVVVEEKQIEQIFKGSNLQSEVLIEDRDKDIEVRDSFSMTEPVKENAFIQTVELEDRAVSVNILEKKESKPSQVADIPVTNAVSTQTEKRKPSSGRPMKNSNNGQKNWLGRNDLKIDDDGIIINNIVCPPPLFYNSEWSPAIQIERQVSFYNQDEEDGSSENVSIVDSCDVYGLEKKEDNKEKEKELNFMNYHPPKLANRKQEPELNIQPEKYIPQARPGERVSGLSVAPQKETLFPLLSALINELSYIKDPQFLLEVSRKLEVSGRERVKSHTPSNEVMTSECNVKMINAPSVVAAVATALTKKSDTSQRNLKEKSDEGRIYRKEQNKKTVAPEKLSPKERAENAKKKSKLVFGLTNTQRLRLQKANPTWLKNVEKDAISMKSKKGKNIAIEVEDLTATNFSDTLTEVRRLAEMELNSTAGGDTLQLIASEAEGLESTVEQNKVKRSLPMKSIPSTKKTQVIKPGISEKSPPTTRHGHRMSGDRKTQQSLLRSSIKKSSRRDTSPKSRLRIHQRYARQKREKDDFHQSSDSDELFTKKKPVPLERHMFGITSPLLDEQRMNDYEDCLSARSDLPSSRSRSIEVRLPSADRDIDDNATISNDESQVTDESEEEEDIPLPDDSTQGEPKVQELNFPRYVSRDMSLPESIEGNPNASLNVSDDITHNSPLESTRQSKMMTEDQNESHILQSTDYDTRQFHSTDEPELQGLVSEEDNQSVVANSSAQSLASVRTSQKFPVINPQLSENSPVPSVRRSTNKLDAGALSYLPSMSLSKGQMSPTSSRPSTPKVTSQGRTPDFEQMHRSVRGSITPRSGTSSPKRQTPRARRQIIDYKNSIHTDSVSSYMPSDPENVLVSLSSNSGNYSDDFQPLASGESGEGNSSVEQLPKIIPSRKLGYTIS